MQQLAACSLGHATVRNKARVHHLYLYLHLNPIQQSLLPHSIQRQQAASWKDADCASRHTSTSLGAPLAPHAWAPHHPAHAGLLHPASRFSVHVLIPCYKEGLDVVSGTVQAALDALLPAGVRRTVYLLDDGGDSHKRAYVEAFASPEVSAAVCWPMMW